MSLALAVLACGTPIVQSSAQESNSHSRETGSLPTVWPGHDPSSQAARALYFMTNLASNSIVALPIGENGFPDVAASTTTATGGTGGNLFSAVGGSPNGPDAFSSQGSVQIASDVSAVFARSKLLLRF